MGRSRDWRRSNSLPGYRKSWNIDEALSSGFQHSRESQREIYPFLKEKEYTEIINCLEKKLKDLEKKVEDLTRQLECSKANETEANDLKEKLQDFKKKEEDLLEQLRVRGDFELKAVLRQVLSNFKRGHHYCINRLLMEKARNMFPKEFPQDESSQRKPLTFTRTIGNLVDQKMSSANRKNELLLSNTDHELLCLQEVATAFRSHELGWSDGERGKQFFILCKSVAQWNNDTFHPETKGLSRPLIMNTAYKGLFHVDDKGVFSADGVNLGPLVMELLYV